MNWSNRFTGDSLMNRTLFEFFSSLSSYQKKQGHSKSVGTLVLGGKIISVLNNRNIYYSCVNCLSVSDGPGDAQSPSTEEPPTPTESPEVKEGS